MCSHIQEIQCIGHTIAAAETLKAAIRVLTPEKQKLLLRNIVIKENPCKEQKHCQKVKAAQEDIGSQNQRGRSRTLRTTYPNHENYHQQKKCIKVPVEIHNIKQRDGESTEEFMRRYKIKSRDVMRAPEYMKIFGFIHGITNPELIKRLHDKILKSVDEMMRVKTQMIPAPTPLVGFGGEIIWPRGQISLLVKIGDEEHSTSAWMNFMVVRSPSPYNGIIGRPGVRRIRVVPSTAYVMQKFLVAGETVTLRSSRIILLGCIMVSRPGCLPVKQNKRGQEPERNKAICEEVEKLVEADIMKEVHYHSWLSNPVMEGTFLGYKVDADGLRVCPDKVEAILSLPSPRCLKDVQKLNENLTSLNRFLSKSVEKYFPFFKTLKRCTKKSDFQMTVEAEMAFKQMKQWIAELPMLTAPKENEDLIMYLAAAKEAISAVLMIERDGKQITSLAMHYKAWKPRTSVKGQILADFIIERSEDDTLDTPIKDGEELPDLWILFTDGSSCIDSFGAGLIITNQEGTEFTYALRFKFNATNNEAEYEDLIAGLWIAKQMGVQNLQANVDSKRVANQVNRVYVAKESSMIKYLEKVKNLASTFKEFSIKQVPIGENKKADALSKMTSTSFAHLSKQVLVEELKKKLIDEKEVLAVVEEEGHTWMTPVYEYLTKGILPEEKRKERAIRRKAGRYVVTNRTLYKKSFLGPWLRCVGPLQANYVLREIHEG
uniref:Reverse transcriptase domain-containing protein n=1 Tax=Tanacetum cinerariifolium TaxID=118510 RepID=A0A699HHV7_TANCI|nr:reverse transcriptase domain-containing protein [Tanacetum cinerariifolium]